MSMYKGKAPFSREQSIFVVEAILCSVLDRIESGLPSCIDWEDRKKHADRIGIDPLSMSAYDRGAIETAGMALGVFYAQLSDDGLGIYDALACASVSDVDFPTACERLVEKSWANKGKSIKERLKASNTLEEAYGDIWPNARLYAESFVDEVFEEIVEYYIYAKLAGQKRYKPLGDNQVTNIIHARVYKRPRGQMEQHLENLHADNPGASFQARALNRRTVLA